MIKLNIGCGRTNFGEEWIHIDAIDAPHIKYHNICELGAFRNECVDIIYASHVLEYFDREEVISVLKEWYRVLKPNGILRLAVPDFDKLIEVYQKSGKLSDILGPLYGKISINNNQIYHKTCYTYPILCELLDSVGFKDVLTWDYRINKVDDCSKAHWPNRPKNIKSGKFDKDQIHISLNLECTK